MNESIESWDSAYTTLSRGEAGMRTIRYDNVPMEVGSYEVSVQSLADVPYPPCRTIEFFWQGENRFARVKIY